MNRITSVVFVVASLCGVAARGQPYSVIAATGPDIRFLEDQYSNITDVADFSISDSGTSACNVGVEFLAPPRSFITAAYARRYVQTRYLEPQHQLCHTFVCPGESPLAATYQGRWNSSYPLLSKVVPGRAFFVAAAASIVSGTPSIRPGVLGTELCTQPDGDWLRYQADSCSQASWDLVISHASGEGATRYLAGSISAFAGRWAIFSDFASGAGGDLNILAAPNLALVDGNMWQILGSVVTDRYRSALDDSGHLLYFADAFDPVSEVTKTFVLRAHPDQSLPDFSVALATLGSQVPGQPSGVVFGRFDGLSTARGNDENHTFLRARLDGPGQSDQTVATLVHTPDDPPLPQWRVLYKLGGTYSTAGTSPTNFALTNIYDVASYGPLVTGTFEVIEHCTVVYQGSQQGNRALMGFQLNTSPTTAREIAVEGGSTGTTNEVWTGFQLFGCNRSGAVLFGATTLNTQTQQAGQGLYVSSPGEPNPTPVALAGEAVEVAPGITRVFSGGFECSYGNGSDGRTMCINNLGEVAFVANFTDFTRAALVWRPTCQSFSPCDLNNDGIVDANDIDVFISLVGGAADPLPCWRSINLDLNEDGNVDQGDAIAFSNLIYNGCE